MSDEITGMDKVIRAVLRQSGHGSDDTSLSDLLRGPNTSGLGSLTQANQDNQGWTFITKPYLNLHPDNIAQSRTLAYLADEDGRSIGKAVKALLTNRRFNLAFGDNSTPSELVDEEQAYNYLMSGTLRSLTGFPDHVGTFWSSEEGVAKETYMLADYRPEFYGEFTLNASFWNIEGDLVTKMLTALYWYQGEAAYGSVVPWPIFNSTNTIDSQFRIYRIIVDKNKENILKIACTGQCVVETPADGAAFNFVNENIMAADNEEISIPIKCTGVRYNDPKIVSDFNRTTAYYNPAMAEDILNESRRTSTRVPFEVPKEKGMVRIFREEYKLCRSFVFPFIYEEGSFAKLEWWIRAEELTELLTDV